MKKRKSWWNLKPKLKRKGKKRQTEQKNKKRQTEEKSKHALG